MPPEKQNGKEESKNTILRKYYLEIFQGNPAGMKILEDLSIRFENRPSFVAGDSHATAKNEGQREVILYIYQQIANAKE